MPFIYRPRNLRTAKNPETPETYVLLKEADALLVAREVWPYSDTKRIVKILRQVSISQRGIAYTERWVALYACARKKGPRAASLANQIRRFHKDRGDEEGLQDFEVRLKLALGSFGLTNHGYIKLFASRDRAEVARDLSQLLIQLDSLGLPIFVNSGTLLGAVREGTFIGHDDDVDLAVILPVNKLTKVTGLLRDYHNRIAEKSIYGLEHFYKAGSPIIKITTAQGLHVDIFPAWFEGEDFYVWPHTFGELKRDDVLPLGEVRLEGQLVPAPRRPEKMLEINYGPEWEVPDKGFSFSWQSANAKFKYMIRDYKRRRNFFLLLYKLKRLFSKGQE